MYGKQTECAIAVMSRLVEVYDEGCTNVSADDLADSRGYPHPFVRKILSVLTHAGLVIGSRGPGGGCTLAKHPSTIKLYDVFKLFEREEERDICPFGGRRCGDTKPCPLHKKFMDVQEAMSRLLHETTFEVFLIDHQEKSDIQSDKKK